MGRIARFQHGPCAANGRRLDAYLTQPSGRQIGTLGGEHRQDP